MLIRCEAQLLKLQKQKVSSRFNIYFLNNECMTAFILSNLSVYYLRNSSSSGVGVFDYINVI
jgi:hypothetical protein